MKNVHIGWGPVGMTKIITKKSTKLKLNASNISLEMGATFKLSILSDYTETPVYKSSDENVITVDQEGNVSVIGYGTAYITVTSGELKGTCVIKVAKPEEPDVPVIPDEPDEPVVPEEPTNKLDNTKLYFGYIPNSDGLIESYESITEDMLYEAFTKGLLQERVCEPSEFDVIVPENGLAIVLLPNQMYTARKNALGTILPFDNNYGVYANNLKVGNFYLYGEWNLSTEVAITVNIA